MFKAFPFFVLMNNFSLKGFMLFLSDSIKANKPEIFSTFPSLNLKVIPLLPTSKDSISSDLHFSFIFRMFVGV